MGVLGNRILLNTSTNNGRDLSGLWNVHRRFTGNIIGVERSFRMARRKKKNLFAQLFLF